MQALEIHREDGIGLSPFLHEGLDLLIVAVALQTKDAFREGIDRFPDLVKMDPVSPGGLFPGENLHLLEKIKACQVGLSVGTGSAESNGSKDARQEGDRVIVERSPFPLAAVLQVHDHIQAQDVGLPLLKGRGLILQRLTDRSFPGEGMLDAQAVSNLVKHDVVEESIEGDVLELIFRN